MSDFRRRLMRKKIESELPSGYKKLNYLESTGTQYIDTDVIANQDTGKRIYNVIDELPIYKERLKDVIIENRDFENLIKTYDRPSAVFYIDPPYVDSEGYYNKKFVSFNKDDHMRLNSVLKAIKGRFILSYNACDFVCNMYNGFNIRYVSRNNLLPAKPENRSEFKEVIITNY